MRILLEAGVDIDHVNNLGWTALLEAVILGDGGPVYQEIVGILVDAGAQADTGSRRRDAARTCAPAWLHGDRREDGGGSGAVVRSLSSR